MQIDKFLKLVKQRRSCRSFKPDPIPDVYIEKILEAARWAMSGANGQPWEFIVVKNQEMRKQILNIYTSYMDEKWYIEQTRTEDLRFSGSIRKNHLETVSFRDAPVIIVICGDPRMLQASVAGSTFLGCEGGFDAIYIKNMANATQMIHLAASACDLGSGWISVSYLIEERLKKLLNVPNQLKIPTMVSIGYPAHAPTVGYRRELKELVHYDEYDLSRARTGEDVINFIRNLRQKVKPVSKNVN